MKLFSNRKDIKMLELMERAVRALERIADAVEANKGGTVTTMGGGNGAGNPPPPPGN